MARIDHLVDLDGIGVDPNPGAIGLTHLHGKIGGEGHPLGGGIGGDSGTARCESEGRQNGGHYFLLHFSVGERGKDWGGAIGWKNLPRPGLDKTELKRFAFKL